MDEKENMQGSKSPGGWQPFVFRFVSVVIVLLIVIPVMPMVKSNFVYSLSGDAPKIYWYLSRASGFVTLSILWVSMALGLGITNKMVHLWPGTSTAFAMHQYTSLLGLLFAASHGLILMGDHFVDFSLPRLVVPFSIAYETFWVGMGQIVFYVWLVVILSFYLKPFIGQKVWRLIHYTNFMTYTMGFLHGLMSGTDSYHAVWTHWYFGVSGTSLVVLLAYRIYDSRLKRMIPLPQSGFKRAPNVVVTATASASAIFKARRNIPQALFHEQTRNLKTSQKAEVKVIFPSPAVRLQSEHKVRVRIFNEPTTKPIPELQQNINILQDEIPALFERMKRNLGQMPVEPTTPRRRS